ncbi:MAG: type I pantothenate kinase [Actinomycetota bacterium]
MTDAAEALAARVEGVLRPPATTVVAVAGPVAVGKSTLAESVGEALRRRGATVEVVSTDGFLLPTAELDARGILDRKGFPESYDVDALRHFLAAVRDELRRGDVSVPVYSHETYDIVPGERRAVPPVDILVLEGLNALYATVGLVDFGVYVDAPLPFVEQWYVERFVALCATATPTSYYSVFAALDRDAQVAAARSVYEAINLPNLVDHVAPSRRFATVVVEKQADHGLGAITEVASP